MIELTARQRFQVWGEEEDRRRRQSQFLSAVGIFAQMATIDPDNRDYWVTAARRNMQWADNEGRRGQ